jgi:signal transduction histidine kinase
MKDTQAAGISLLWRILLSTSIALTVLFGLTGWLVQSYAGRVSEHSLEEEVRTSLQAYEALWSTRAHHLASISRIISSMSDVRAAFATRDKATIRDTAAQLWPEVAADAAFLVLEPTGEVITSLGGESSGSRLALTPEFMERAAAHFPRQVEGYITRGRHLYYIVLTPVYVQAAQGQALLNVLLVASDVDDKLAYSLKESTHGSDFAFVSGSRLIASSLPLAAADLTRGPAAAGGARRLLLHGVDYLALGRDLKDVDGKPAGELYIIRSFEGPSRALMELRRNVTIIWILAVVAGLAFTYLLARRILEPVKRLDRAVEEVIKQNYDYRVAVETKDELGRLAKTFNAMCDSIRTARDELIRQERISTIGRLSSSIVHDLRNPLAAIYGGAEMLVDAGLSTEQRDRIAVSIYRSSRRIQELLQELTDMSRAKAKRVESCRLVEIVQGARDLTAQTTGVSPVSIAIDIPGHVEVYVDRDRMERVFMNLLHNSLEAMPNGGTLRVTSRQDATTVTVQVEDSGPGIPEKAWATLFQPFASFGKKNGLGLGLALSRQTVLDYAGDLWADRELKSGARFFVRLPKAQTAVASGRVHAG